jgi:hypothetical protein
MLFLLLSSINVLGQENTIDLLILNDTIEQKKKTELVRLDVQLRKNISDETISCFYKFPEFVEQLQFFSDVSHIENLKGLSFGLNYFVLDKDFQFVSLSNNMILVDDLKNATSLQTENKFYIPTIRKNKLKYIQVNESKYNDCLYRDVCFDKEQKEIYTTIYLNGNFKYLPKDKYYICLFYAYNKAKRIRNTDDFYFNGFLLSNYATLIVK